MPPTAQAVIQRVTDTLYAPFRYAGAGIPEGVQVSEPGWIYRDTTNGILWYKKTGSAATGWKARPGTLVMDTTQTGCSGSSPTTLQTWSLPANTLANNGDAIRITVGLGGAANGNTKEVELSWNGNVIKSYSSTVSSGLYCMVVTIVRSASGVQKATGVLNISGTGSNVGTGIYSGQSEPDNAAIVVTVVATGGATNDVIKQIFQVELLPAP